MNNKFREHGNSSFCVDGNIVTVVMKGAFNEYGFRVFTNCIKSIIDDLQGERFSIMMNMIEATGGTPELYVEAEQYNEWLNSQNLIAKAIVIDSIVTLDIYNSRVKANKIQDYKSFDNELDAIKWLKNKS